jgi:hypothetical protein
MVAIYGRSAPGSESASFILKAVDAGQVTLEVTESVLEVDIASTNNNSQVVLDINPVTMVRPLSSYINVFDLASFSK